MAIYDGNGSRFNTRFSPGLPIYAKQLNDLANGVNSAVPQPYIGAGATIAYTPGGSIITGFIGDEPIIPTFQHPFKVNNLGLDPEAEQYFFTVVPGTVNSIIPQLGIAANPEQRLDKTPTPKTAWNFNSETGESFIYLKVSCDTSADPQKFPVTDENDALYPRVVSTIVQQANDADSGYVLLASANKNPQTNEISISQMVINSLGAERHQYINPEVVIYYFWSS